MDSFLLVAKKVGAGKSGSSDSKAGGFFAVVN